MIFKRIAIIAILVLCYSQASAQITLKKSFWSGWKYSVNGMPHKKVGNSGDGLSREMMGNEEALQLMEKYKSAQDLAMIAGSIGGALIGWPLGGYVGGGEWKDEYSFMMFIGVPLGVISMVMEGTASKHLKEAVSVYNGVETESLGLMLALAPPEEGRPTTFLVGRKYGF